MAQTDVATALPPTLRPAVLRAFGPLARALHDHAEPGEILRRASLELAGLVGVPRCLAFVREEDRDTFRGVAAHGAAEEHVRHLVSGLAADGLSREIVHTRGPVAIANARNDPRTVRSAMRAWDVVSVLGLPMLDRGRVIGLFFLDVPGAGHDFDAEARTRAEAFTELASVAFVEARIAAAARGEGRVARTQVAALSQALSVEDRLSAALLDGVSDRQMAQVLANATGRSWAVYAEHDRVTSAVPDASRSAGAHVPDLVALGVLEDPAFASAVTADRTRGTTVGPFPEAGLHRRLMVAAAGTGDRRRVVVSVENDWCFAAADRLSARRAAIVFATLATDRVRTVETDRERAQAAALADVLAGVAGPEARQMLDLPTNVRTLLCVVAGPAEVIDPANLRAALRAGLSSDARPLVTTVPAGSAILLEAPPDPCELIDRLRSIFRTVAANRQVQVGVSAAVRGLDMCAQAHDDAVEVLACVRALGADAYPGAAVLAASDIGGIRSLLATAEPSGTQRFVLRTLGALLEPANEHFLLTLVHLADHAWNIRAAADALDVHENTIRYRVRRIEEVSGLAVRTDAVAQMEARMALLVLAARRRMS